MSTKTHYHQVVREKRPVLDWLALLTQIGFGLGLAMVAARCMLLETLRDPFDIRVGGPAAPLGAGADTSIVLDLLCCVPAILVLLRRCLDKTYTIRWSGSLGLIFPLAGWTALSAKWADDKFAAVVSAGNFIAAMALLWAMAQLVRSWTRLRTVAAIAYGLLLAFLVRGFYYKFVDIPTLMEHPERLLEQQGFDPKSFRGIQFAGKISELMGFNSSPNSFAGLIVLLMTIGLGVAIQRAKDRDDPAWTVALALSAPLGIWLLIYAKAKAALVMPVLVLMLFAMLWKWRGPMARQSRKMFWIGVGVVALGIAAVIGHGLYHGGLPTDSLNFRWRYWVAAMRMFRRHPLLGVGWENFGPHYLRDRLPAASEEIRDPHDFLVRFLVELGLVGLVLMLAWMGRLWWELTRPAAPPVIASPVSQKAKLGPVFFIAGIAVAAIVINTFAGLDLNQDGNYIFLEMVNRLLYLCALVLGSLVVALRSLEKPQVDERGAPWILYGILIGIGVFLVHNLIEFSIFEPGPLCLFAVLAGAALGIRLPNRPVRNPGISPAAVLGLGAVAAAWIAAVVWLAIPVTRAEMAAHAGDDRLRAGDYEVASDEYGRAALTLPMNADYAFRAGRALQISVGPPVPLSDPDQIRRAVKLRQRILTWYALAIQADRSFLGAYHLRGIFDLQMDEPKNLVVDFDRVMELNPNEVSLRLEYAHGLEMMRLWPEAKEQLESALRYNEQLDKAEPKRLSEEKVAEIRKEIGSIPD